jgi:hypothetical protein
VLVVGEDESGAHDAGDLAGADGDVLEGAPTPGERGECPFAVTAEGPLQGVAGAIALVEFVTAGRLLPHGPVRLAGGLGVRCTVPGFPAGKRQGAGPGRPDRGQDGTFGIRAMEQTSRYHPCNSPTQIPTS